MPALFDEAITPCPPCLRSSGFGDSSGSDTFDILADGDSTLEPTGQIEFTTEVQASTLAGVRPRRANRGVSGFQIHEYVTKKPAGPAEKRRRPNGAINSPDRKSSLLAQPAQRFRPKPNSAPSPFRTVKQKTETQPKSRGLESKTTKGKIHAPRQDNGVLDHGNEDIDLKKHLRRNTVYIPPDDTTVASVFMGLFSPLKKPRPDSLPPFTEDTKVNTLENRIAQRQARKSLAVSARKAPLQPSAKIAQEAAFRVDVAGKNGGKENIPPGWVADTDKKPSQVTSPSKPSRASTVSARKPVRPSMFNQKSNSISAETVIKQPKKQNPARGVLGDKQNNAKSPSPCSTNNRDALGGSKPPMTSASLNARATALSNRLHHTASHASRTGTRAPSVKELDQKYPALTEDTSKPALYEDNWLSHQETVITQLVNALFEYTDDDPTASSDPDGLRLELLELYHTDEFVHLYKRLQASLSFGNLSSSREILARNSRFGQDIGLKRKFLDIWLQSYDPRALAAALETVVGRKISNNAHLFESGNENLQGRATKGNKMILKKLEGFLETFLLRNDDLDHSLHGVNGSSETQARGYQRTVLRSILLVVLLDQGRQRPGNSLPRRLFVPSSALKSSAAVLQALARVLLPSCGDIKKQLSHLGCRLSYTQHELLEYKYQMDNIAVDLRDGVRLTRLVEVLFFTSDHSDPGLSEVTLKTGEAFLGDEKDLPLSKHLKYPCTSRATKIFNVQIALSALSSVRRASTILDDVRAEDIVDGYREKTMALLWTLVSKWGLTGLVDWDDVGKEITRLRRKASSQIGLEQAQTENWFTRKTFGDTNEPIHLLQQWIAILAALKGLHISNMTTSFADGQIYESIIDEYEPYITERAHRGVEAGSRSLESRLRQLGCSSQFAHLVSPGLASSHLLDRDFTLGALAFLCSRLLSASKRARAATAIQRAWRAHLAERTDCRRAIAMKLASHCAAVVQTRADILWAKEVIVRWWRNVKAQKQRKTAVRLRPLSKVDRQLQRIGRRL